MYPAIDTPSWDYDQDGQKIILVPLQNCSRPAKLLPEDWDRLVTAGVSGYWSCKGPQGRYVYSGTRRAGDLAIVARLIMDAGPDYRVHYHDGDRLNLRSENLWNKKMSPRSYH
jgi:hypothetical protein